MTNVPQLIPTIRAVNPPALYLYEKAMLIQLHKGLTPVKDFLSIG